MGNIVDTHLKKYVITLRGEYLSGYRGYRKGSCKTFLHRPTLLV